ncbi:MAG: IS4 family transposase [Myxococcales bacterium]|nr:IS4 family transposase [Myxococcales bacterium]
MRRGIDIDLEIVFLAGMPTRPQPKKVPPTTVQSNVLETLRELVGPEEILETGRRLGVIQRQRKLDLPALVEATILAMSPHPGVQTSIFVNYLSQTDEPMALSSFYDRFTWPFAELMQAMAWRSIEAVREVTPEGKRRDDLGVLLKEFRDVQVVDSSSHLLKRLARHWAPSTSKVKPAGVKWHAVVSLKDGLPVADRLTEQKLHDSAGLPDGALAAGALTLFDLGYLDVARFVDAILRGADFLTRLKSTHNPVIARVHTGKGDRVKARGMRLEEALVQGVLLDDKGALDLDVLLEANGKSATARVVAELSANDGEFHWYLTSVSREVLSIDDLVEAYRLRWYIELLFKQLKSGAGLDTILASRPGAVAALVYAKIVALCLARLLELAVEERQGRHATTQLALTLVLARCGPLMLAHSFLKQGITLEQIERRMMNIATIVAKTRNQRRERARRKRERALGYAS